MKHTISRRKFVQSASLGLLAATLPTACSHLTENRKLNVGHTGITWWYDPKDALKAIGDIASLGYKSFESFGHVLEHWDERGGLKQHLDAANLPLQAAYCPTILIDPSKRKEALIKIKQWGKLIKKNGGDIAVIGPDNVNRESYNFTDSKSHIVTALNEYSKALADVGITAALHQHTGSCIQTQDEVYAVMEAVDTQFVKLCPDVGELQSGGVNPVKFIEDFLPIIAHAHLKDFNGGRFNDGYCPVGQGNVDMASCINLLEKSTNNIMLMAELNPHENNLPKPPIELARTSKRYLQSLGYTFS